MAAMLNEELVQEVKDRLADRYTAAELCELLDVPVEDIINEYWSRILRRQDVLQTVGAAEEQEDYEDYNDDLS